MGMLRVGVGTCEITFPEEMLPVEGFCSVHDKPKVRILVLENQTNIVIVALELVMLSDLFVEKLQKIIKKLTNIQEDHVWIHVTHAISTPHGPIMEITIPGELNQAQKKVLLYKQEMYEKAVSNAVENACREAIENQQQASIGIGSGICDGNMNHSIETPYGWWTGKEGTGYSNKEISLISFKSRTGRAIGYVINYDLKPCTIDNSQRETGARLISSDLTGAICRKLEEKFHAPVIFLVGAAGDQVPLKQAYYDEVDSDGKVQKIDHGVLYGLQLVETLSSQICKDLFQINSSIKQSNSDPELECRKTSFSWKRKEQTDIKPSRFSTYTAKGEAHIPVYIIRIGSIILVGSTPELNSYTGMQLKKRSKYQYTLPVNTVNGGMKYIPEADAYRQNKWEAQSSFFMPGAAETFVDEAIKLIN